jgi:hypothetical protein
VWAAGAGVSPAAHTGAAVANAVSAKANAMCLVINI